MRRHRPISFLGGELRLHGGLFVGTRKWPACPISTCWSSAAATPVAPRRSRRRARRAHAAGRALRLSRRDGDGGDGRAVDDVPLRQRAHRRRHRARDRRAVDAQGRVARAHRRFVGLRPDDHAVRSRSAQGAALRDDARGRRRRCCCTRIFSPPSSTAQRVRGATLRDGRRHAHAYARRSRSMRPPTRSSPPRPASRRSKATSAAACSRRA